MTSVFTTATPFHILSSRPPTKPCTLILPRTTLFFTLSKTTPSFGLLSGQRRVLPIITNAKGNTTGEQKWTHEGSVTESLSNGMFRVKLDNQEDLIIGYISGRIRKNFVRILPGDRVKVEVSRYDSSRGRIVYRVRTRGPSSD